LAGPAPETGGRRSPTADALGPEWGGIGRTPAVLSAKDRREEDVIVILLRDIRTVFDTRGIDRISHKALLAALLELEEAGWPEYCGLKGDRPPHKLRPNELRAMLRSLGIQTRSIWPQK